MKTLVLLLLPFFVLCCSDRPPVPEYSLTTADLEHYYSQNRIDADRQYTGHNLKVSGVVGSVEPLENASLITFKSAGDFEVLCRMDNSSTVAPGDSVTVIAWNAGLEQRFIKLFNCTIIK